MSPQCGPDLKNSKQIFSHNTPAPKDTPSSFVTMVQHF